MLTECILWSDRLARWPFFFFFFSLAVEFILFSSVRATPLGEYLNTVLEQTVFISIKQICTKGNICLFLVKPLKCAASVS